MKPNNVEFLLFFFTGFVKVAEIHDASFCGRGGLNLLGKRASRLHESSILLEHDTLRDFDQKSIPQNAVMWDTLEGLQKTSKRDKFEWVLTPPLHKTL